MPRYNRNRIIRIELYKLYQVCYWCHKELKFEECTLDHLKPSALGGRTKKENLVISCGRCNYDRGLVTQVIILEKKIKKFEEYVRVNNFTFAKKRLFHLQTNVVALKSKPGYERFKNDEFHNGT